MPSLETNSNRSVPPSIIADRYEVRGELGAGGMGVVYRARDRFLNKEVAIKMLRTSGLTPEMFLRFQTEAKALGKLQHPNVISVYTFGEHDERPFMVVDFIEGITLSEYIKNRGPLTFDEAYPIFEQICDGMSYAHSKGVTHRDLKTANIMLQKNPSTPKVVILDFGIAKLQDDVCGAQTEPGLIFGSPLYMSPEQAGGTVVDARTDIYAMGCIMFEVLTGTTPFPPGQVLELIRKIREDAPPTLSETYPEGTFTDAIEYVVRKSLAKSPASRYQKMSHLKVALSTAKNNPDVVPLHKEEQVIARKPVILTAVLAGVALTVGGIVVTAASQSVKNPGIGHVFVSESSVTVGKTDAIQKHVAREGLYLGSLSETITDEIMARTKDKIATQKIVILKDSQISDKGLDYIPDNVYRVNLTNTKITDAGLKRLTQRCKNLHLIDLAECHNLTDQGLEALVDLPTLKFLTVSSDRCTDNGMKVIKKLKTVEQLSFQGMKNLTDKGLEYIVENPRIRTLRIDTTKITPKGLPLIAKLKHLFLLDMGWLGIGDDGLKMLPNSEVLRSLDISGNPITNKGLQSLRRFKHLKELMIRKVPGVTDDDLEKFEQETGCIAVSM